MKLVEERVLRVFGYCNKDDFDEAFTYLSRHGPIKKLLWSKKTTTFLLKYTKDRHVDRALNDPAMDGITVLLVPSKSTQKSNKQINKAITATATDVSDSSINDNPEATDVQKTPSASTKTDSKAGSSDSLDEHDGDVQKNPSASTTTDSKAGSSDSLDELDGDVQKKPSASTKTDSKAGSSDSLDEHAVDVQKTPSASTTTDSKADKCISRSSESLHDHDGEVNDVISQATKKTTYNCSLSGEAASASADTDEATDNELFYSRNTRKTRPATRETGDKDRQAILAEVSACMVPPERLKWDDIVGLEETKLAMKVSISGTLELKHIKQINQLKAMNILLYGPPGTGKTMLAESVASENKCTLFRVSTSLLTNQYVGQSSKMCKELFNMAKEHAPAIIFIDEVEAIMKKRGGHNETCFDQVKTQMLQDIDGLTRCFKKQTVFLIAATNLPWDLDSAFVRRFNEKFYVPLPAAADRAALIDKIAPNSISQDARKEAEKLTEGFSNSDIVQAFKSANSNGVKELIQRHSYESVRDQKMQPRDVSDTDVLDAIGRFKKTVDVIELNKFVEFNSL